MTVEWLYHCYTSLELVDTAPYEDTEVSPFQGQSPHEIYLGLKMSGSIWGRRRVGIWRRAGLRRGLTELLVWSGQWAPYSLSPYKDMSVLRFRLFEVYSEPTRSASQHSLFRH